MKIQIKTKWTGLLIFETDAESLGNAILEALAAKANLYGADLSGADLQGANLRGANLQGAILRGADMLALSQCTILPEGDLIVWKKLQGNVLAKLKIPAAAKRVGGLIGRKCRAEFAEILEGSGHAKFDGTVYRQGETIKPDSYDPNPLVECSHGIHFFITAAEAEAYE